MATNELARPAPIATRDHRTRGWAGKGKIVTIPVYSGREVAAYRAARGVTQGEVAARMRVAQSLVARYESDRPGVDFQEKDALAELTAIDAIAAGREKIVQRGLADLAAIRATRKAGAR